MCHLMCVAPLEGAVLRLHNELQAAPRARLQWRAAEPRFRELPVHPRACPPLAALRERPTVYFKRLAKSGGTLASNIFEALERETQRLAKMAAQRQRSSVRRLHQEFHVIKDDNVTQPPVDAFSIASVRNLCDLYVSQWEFQREYGCEWGPLEHKGRCRRAANQPPGGRFEAWVERSAGKRVNVSAAPGTPGSARRVGAWSRRFWCTYLSARHSPPRTPELAESCWHHAVSTRDSSEATIVEDLRAFAEGTLTVADCWVRQENLAEDLKACLRRYEACKLLATGPADRPSPLSLAGRGVPSLRHTHMAAFEGVIDRTVRAFNKLQPGLSGALLAQKQPKPGRDAECERYSRLGLERAVDLGTAHGAKPERTVLDLLAAVDPELLALTGCCVRAEQRTSDSSALRTGGSRW